ncbi:MAG: hypothetical protein K9N62_06075 [Verrucomicrobia bacterium]|nr:hypothetical protein [Verrucomicrobiota bacterium]
MMTVKRIVLFWVLTALCLARPQAATTPLYQNLGVLTSTPQIDATAFANHGDFSVFSILPFETQNTLNFTNTGRMFGNPGFRFETISATSVRTPARSFVNGVDGRVTVGSLARFLPAQTLTNFGLAFENSQLLISATTVTNRGDLLADARGRIRIEGEDVDLSRSAVGILPLNGGQGYVTPTNFVPDIGIYDRYWGMDSGQNLNPNVPTPMLGLAGLLTPVRGTTNFGISTPRHQVTNEFSTFGFGTSLTLTNGKTYVLTNAVTPSNWVVQVVMVQAIDTNLNIDVKFTPSTILTNPYTTPIVEFKKTETNVLAGGFFTNHIYMFDRVASETNFVILTNLVTLNTFMPGNYEVTRETPRSFARGMGPNATNAADLIYNATYTNDLATNLYSAYGYNVTNLAFILPPVAGASLTNLPGRIEINARNVNLNRSRIRGEGIVKITSDSVSGANMVIDSPNLAFDLKSADGNLLVVKSLAKDTIERVSGEIYAWSAMWTNQTGSVTTNSAPDPNDPAVTVDTVETNVIEVGFHLFVVDGSGIQTVQPVFTSDFTVRSTNVVLSDTIRLREKILVEADALKLSGSGRLLFPPELPDWNRSAFPSLKTLENEGVISLFGSANFGGRDGGADYQSIVNRGEIEAFNMVFKTEAFENSGILIAEDSLSPIGVGTIRIEAGSAKLEGGSITAGGEIRIRAKDLKLRDIAITNQQAIVFEIENSVADLGEPANAVITTEGFHFLKKPTSGDLLGTRIESIAPRFLAIPHTVAGVDLGPTAAGYVNNAAIGQLVLTGDFDSLFAFYGSDTSARALYVDYLELGDSVAADLDNSIQVASNVTIYFADSNVSADVLNGALGGRIQWVSDFVGPNSTMDVVLGLGSDARTLQVNRSLRLSGSIDSDGDGIFNADDDTPFTDVTGQNIVRRASFDSETSVLSLFFEAKAGQSYVIEVTDDLASGEWLPISRYTNSSVGNESTSIKDKIPTGSGSRFYRIRPGK